jgi:hypothetical protein
MMKSSIQETAPGGTNSSRVRCSSDATYAIFLHFCFLAQPAQQFEHSLYNNSQPFFLSEWKWSFFEVIS